MKYILAAVFILHFATACFADDNTHIAKMIACEPGEESMISQTYEVFLALIAKREVKKNEIRFPARLATRREDGVVISHSFYVTPNELRGFELYIPKDFIEEKDGLLVSNASLTIDREEMKQGIRCLILTKAAQSNR